VLVADTVMGSAWRPATSSTIELTSSCKETVIEAPVTSIAQQSKLVVGLGEPEQDVASTARGSSDEG